MRRNGMISVAGFTVISLLFLTASCSDDRLEQVNVIGIPQQEDNRALSGEERAIKALEMFLDNMEDKASTRSGAARFSKVVGVEKKTTDAYRGASSVTRTLGTAMPVYELTLENNDATKGFAVVTESEPELCELMAYAPVGAISDTVYNKGLAEFFRDLAVCSDAMVEEAEKEQAALATRGDIWQPYSKNGSFFRIFDTKEFVRYLTQYEIDNDAPGFPYVVVDYAVTTGDVIPALWNQTAPYNNDMTVNVTGSSEKVRVGCIPVACGQIMSYYKKTVSYDWNLLTASPTIANNTSAAREVARLLIHMHQIGNLTPHPDTNQSSGGRRAPEYIFDDMGYDYAYQRNYTVYGASACYDSIYNNVKFNHPVLMIGEVPDQHAWVVDAVINQEWWYYSAAKVHSNYPPYEHFDVTRERYAGQFYHCNWGWGGHSNGWYYAFTPQFTDGKEVNFDVQKAIMTQIKPK